MISYLKEHIEYIKDAFIAFLSWFAYKIIILSSILINNKVEYSEVKQVIEMLQPIIGLITTFLVLLTALVRYNQVKNKKNKKDGE